jgi:predicted O-linked N-acetylglucosamine transferase (SPINDLY family)
VLRLAGRFEAAAADYAMAGSLSPDIKFLTGAHLEARLQACAWLGIEAEIARATAGIERGDAVSHPFTCMAFSDSPDLQRKAAQIWVRETCPADASLGPITRRPPGGKIRIGYFSSDFREHPVSRLVAELIETHDRSRFEVSAFAWGPPSRDELRQRLERAFDRFLDVQGKSNKEIAILARGMSLDIAVDLGGHTHGSRPGIFAMRAAPLQINYLGYPGTSGASYMDYLIADPVLIPTELQRHYSEKVIYLPYFQANDSKRRISDRTFTRQELGLPASGVVFCCFNTSYKIAPGTMDSWMRILGRVPGSVLLLFAADAAVAENLRREARNRAVAPERLCFAGKLPPSDYLARYRAADLFLDTLPYNAGTVASDALWAGLPVLTRVGTAFAGRMAASLLQSVGLPELIASTADEYENLAVALANDPQRRLNLRRTLTQRRLDETLFDTRNFARHLETGYAEILRKHLANLPPDHVVVTSDSP